MDEGVVWTIKISSRMKAPGSCFRRRQLQSGRAIPQRANRGTSPSPGTHLGGIQRAGKMVGGQTTSEHRSSEPALESTAATPRFLPPEPLKMKKRGSVIRSSLFCDSPAGMDVAAPYHLRFAVALHGFLLVSSGRSVPLLRVRVGSGRVRVGVFLPRRRLVPAGAQRVEAPLARGPLASTRWQFCAEAHWEWRVPVNGLARLARRRSWCRPPRYCGWYRGSW